jgi:ketosteroid isomerase-like protein
MSNESRALQADDQFFAMLIRGDADVLNVALTDDFILIDVMSGSEFAKVPLLEVIGSGELKFESIEPSERKARMYGSVAVVTGRTKMKMRFGGEEVSANSRYTHVFVKDSDRWRLASAQGTPIAAAPPR